MQDGADFTNPPTQFLEIGITRSPWQIGHDNLATQFH
jgi:hypothetical protein